MAVSKVLNKLIESGPKQPDLTELSETQGLTSNPTDPGSVAEIGGNEHQAKMAGTTNNKLNAMRQAISEEMQLSTEKRQAKDVRTQGTAGEIKAVS